MYFTKSILVAGMLLLCSSLFAQPVPDITAPTKQAMEIGLQVGTASIAGDIAAPDFFTWRAANINIGVFALLPIDSKLSLKFGISFNELNATDVDFPRNATRRMVSSNTLTEISALMQWEPLQNENFDEEGKFIKGISPYFYFGLGLAIGSADVDFGNIEFNQPAAVNQDIENARSSFITLPFGLGLKGYISDQFTLGVEAGLRPVFSDYLDGISQSANPEMNDWYGVLNLTAGYRLKKN